MAIHWVQINNKQFYNETEDFNEVGTEWIRAETSLLSVGIKPLLVLWWVISFFDLKDLTFQGSSMSRISKLAETAEADKNSGTGTPLMTPTLLRLSTLM